MFKWIRANKALKAQVAEMQTVIADQKHLLGVRFEMIEQRDALADNLAHANKYQRDMIGKGLGQVGINWTAEKIYLAKLLKEYHDAGDARVILNRVYQSNHSVDAIQKAIKRWDKRGV